MVCGFGKQPIISLRIHYQLDQMRSEVAGDGVIRFFLFLNKQFESLYQQNILRSF